MKTSSGRTPNPKRTSSPRNQRANTSTRTKGVSPSKIGGIKEIAQAAGVSIGTVDRALHSRSGIRAATRAKVVEIAKRLGYRPNLAARYLKLSHQKRISVHLPQQIASFFDTLREGIRQASLQFQGNLDVEFHSYPRIGEGEFESVQSVLDGSYDGIILAPSSLSEITPLIHKATIRGIPVVCVATDAPGTERLTAITSDPFTSGAIAAELLTQARKGGQQLAIVTGELSTFDHSEKVRGVRAMLSELKSPISLVDVIEAHDDSREAYQQTCELLRRRPGICGIYVSTANSLPVIRALEEKERLHQTSVVTTDLFPEVVQLIRTGKVLATMYQRPLTQGRMAFEALYRFLMEGIRPKPAHKLPPHIVLRSNINLFVQNSLFELDEEVSR